MPGTFSVYSPFNAPQTVQCTSGNTYSIGANQVIGGVSPTDINDLERAGFERVDQMGQSNAPIFAEGNVSRQVFGTAVNPGATGVDSVLAVYSLPANAFDIAGRGLSVFAQGSVANNTNAKRIKIYYGCTTAVVGSTVTGGTVVADTGSYSTTGAAGWSLEANIFKSGANGSNTQVALHASAQIGSVNGSLLVPSAVTAPENAAILVAVTGNATTTATDIGLSLFVVNAMN